MNGNVRLDLYDNSWYKPGSVFKRVSWIIISNFFFQNRLALWNAPKILLLKLFGAKVGRDVVIKPSVTIKYPWFLEVGNNVWIGENTWIDNLANVTIQDNVCISQGVYLLTGNHNFAKPEFDLFIKPIKIENGVWLGAKSIVCPGIICYTNSVLTVGSIATSNLKQNIVYQGNPAKEIRTRDIFN